MPEHRCPHPHHGRPDAAAIDALRTMNLMVVTGLEALDAGDDPATATTRVAESAAHLVHAGICSRCVAMLVAAAGIATATMVAAPYRAELAERLRADLLDLAEQAT